MRMTCILFAATLVLSGACLNEPSAPSGPSGADLRAGSPTGAVPTFLRPAPDAPSIANPVVSFYAKRGERREAVMLYHARPGAADSTTFVRFRVGSKSLPAGSPFTSGDSVLITMTLVDPVALIVDFQPAGLRFDPKDPPELRMSFAETDPDVNADGVVNQKDTVLTKRLDIWREETTADPWVSLPSNRFLGLHEVEAAVDGFTRYAIAY